MKHLLLATIAGTSLLVSAPRALSATYDFWDLNVSIAKYETGFSVKLGASTTNSVAAGIFKVTPTGADASTAYNDSSALHPRTDGFVSPDLGVMPTGTGSFYSFCTDFSVYMASGDFDPTPFAGQNGVSPNWAVNGIQRVAWLYNNIWLGTFGGNIANIGSTAAAALQLAIWNTLYDADQTVSSGYFTVTAGNAGVLTLANSYLSSGFAGAGDYASTWLQPMSTTTGGERGNQGLIYQPVAVPDSGGTLAMLGFGLLGLGLVQRLLRRTGIGAGF
jgi:hypothetical protein